MIQSASPSNLSEMSPGAIQWLENVDALVSKMNPEVCQQSMEKFEGFLEGERSWAEVQGWPTGMLWDLAERAHRQFERGQLPEARKTFKALSTMDHRIAYFHTALGAIHQRSREYFDALAEYTVALDLDEKDVAAWTNRGEIYLQMGFVEQALADLDRAIALDPQKSNAWAQRAHFLKQKAVNEDPSQPLDA